MIKLFTTLSEIDCKNRLWKRTGLIDFEFDCKEDISNVITEFSSSIKSHSYKIRGSYKKHNQWEGDQAKSSFVNCTAFARF